MMQSARNKRKLSEALMAMRAKARFLISLAYLNARCGGAGGSVCLEADAEAESSFDSSCRGCRLLFVVVDFVSVARI